MASIFACVVLAHSTQLLAQAAAPEVAAPKAAATVTVPPSEETTPQPAGESVADTSAETAAPANDEATANEAPAPEKHDIGSSRVEAELHKIEAERANYSRFLPWLTVGVGAALTAGGTAWGLSKVYGCSGECSTSAWIGIAVVTGTFIATVGTIWVVHANADVRELDSKHYQLEQELERIRFSANLPNKSDLKRNEMFSMRFAFAD